MTGLGGVNSKRSNSHYVLVWHKYKDEVRQGTGIVNYRCVNELRESCPANKKNRTPNEHISVRMR
jgi:hypothetical protein